MGILFDVSEVLNFAVFIEQNGFEFYTEAARKFSDPKIVELFKHLAGEEIKHENLFKKMAQSVGGHEIDESVAGEYNEYMKEFCKNHSLADRESIKGKVAGIQTVADALEMALSFEKDSVVFFAELRELTDFDNKGSVEKIIREELTHVRKLLMMKKGL